MIEDYAQLGNRPGPIEEGVQRLQSLVPKDAELQYTPQTLLEFGEPTTRILQTACERDADLIVLGRARR